MGIRNEKGRFARPEYFRTDMHKEDEDGVTSIEESRAYILHYAERGLYGSLENVCATALREKNGIAYTIELK